MRFGRSSNPVLSEKRFEKTQIFDQVQTEKMTLNGTINKTLLMFGLLLVTASISWRYEQNTPYTPCPVLMDGKLYFLKGNNGYLSCLDARDGTEHYTNQKLEGITNIFTSPLGVKDRIYVTGTNGTTCVVQTGEEFELISQNILEDSFYASPVVIGNSLYLRGENYLYCISFSL